MVVQNISLRCIFMHSLFPPRHKHGALAAIGSRETNMSKAIVFNLILITTFGTNAQVVNNLSSDRTNIYFHALDSATKIIKITASFEEVVVYGDRSITQNFPDTVDGTPLVTRQSDSKKIPKIKKGEARLVIRSLQIIRDEFKIPIMTWGHEGMLGDGMYVFRYQYIPETMTYKLKDIKKGIRL